MKKSIRKFFRIIIILFILVFVYLFLCPRVKVVKEHLRCYPGTHMFIYTEIFSKIKTELISVSAFIIYDGKIILNYKLRNYSWGKEIPAFEAKNIEGYFDYLIEDRIYPDLVLRDIDEADIVFIYIFKPMFIRMVKRKIRVVGPESTKTIVRIKHLSVDDPLAAIQKIKPLVNKEPYFPLKEVYLDSIFRLENPEVQEKELKIFLDKYGNIQEVTEMINAKISRNSIRCHQSSEKIEIRMKQLKMVISFQKRFIPNMKTKLPLYEIDYYFAKKEYAKAYKLLKAEDQNKMKELKKEYNYCYFAYLCYINEDYQACTFYLTMYFKLYRPHELAEELKSNPNNLDLIKYGLLRIYYPKKCKIKLDLIDDINPDNLGSFKEEFNIRKKLSKPLKKYYDKDEAVLAAREEGKKILVLIRKPESEVQESLDSYEKERTIKFNLIPLIILHDNVKFRNEYHITNNTRCLFLNNEGEELDRTGCRRYPFSFQSYIDVFNKIYNEKHNFKEYFKRYQEGERTPEIFEGLVEIFIRRDEIVNAVKFSQEMFQRYPDLPESKICFAFAQRFQMHNEWRESRDPRVLEKRKMIWKIFISNYHKLNKDSYFYKEAGCLPYRAYEYYGDVENFKVILDEDIKLDPHGYSYFWTKTGDIDSLLKHQDELGTYYCPRNYFSWLEKIKDKDNAKDLVIGLTDFLNNCRNKKYWDWEKEYVPNPGDKAGFIDEISGKEVYLGEKDGILCFILPNLENYHLKELIVPIYGWSVITFIPEK